MQSMKKKITPWFIKSLWFLFTTFICREFERMCCVHGMYLDAVTATILNCIFSSIAVMSFFACLCSNGYTYALSHDDQVRRIYIFSCLGNWLRYKNEKRPLLLLIFLSISHCIHSIYSKYIYMCNLFFLLLFRACQITFVKLSTEQYASDRIKRFKKAAFICFKTQFALISQSFMLLMQFVSVTALHCPLTYKKKKLPREQVL